MASKSLIVVIKGPLAAAGSICNELNNIGIIHPNKLEIVKDVNIDDETIRAILILSSTPLMFALFVIFKKAKQITNVNKDTIKPNAKPFLNSDKICLNFCFLLLNSLLAKLLTHTAKLCVPTLPLKPNITGWNNTNTVNLLMTPSKALINKHTTKSKQINIASQGIRLLTLIPILSSSSCSPVKPANWL